MTAATSTPASDQQCPVDALARRICAGVHAVSVKHPDWSFSGQDQRGDAHDIAQYPAMMVPRMQGMLMDAAAAALCAPPSVIDPFVGSGTTMVEAMRRGWAFCGRDINPLAILLCKAKAESYVDVDLQERQAAVLTRLSTPGHSTSDVSFPGMEKWFPKDVSKALGQIRTAIQAESNVIVRRLLWCTLAETVRTSSNSRTSTFKLHIRPADDRVATGNEVLKRFKTNLGNVVSKIQAEEQRRLENNVLHKPPDLRVADIRIPATFPKVNLLVTSPPYGDNTTTVPYGQFSFLPLQWIDFEDIEAGLTREAVRNTHALDTSSLGGRKRTLAPVSDELCDRVHPLKPDFERRGT